MDNASSRWRIPEINPPKGRRPWIIPEARLDSGLCYLAWGRRRYGEDPIPVARQTGYVYTLVLRGSPLLRIKDGGMRCRPGSFFILHPDQPMGWIDAPKSEQGILCWIWEHPPVVSRLCPKSDRILAWTLPASAFAPFDRIHRNIRRELARGDDLSGTAIRQQRVELDILIARTVSATHNSTHMPDRLLMALDWMQSNAASTRPVADLGDLLGLSPATLTRTFKKHLGHPPMEHFNRLKAETATRRLRMGDSVKTIAIDLGYRHPHDFSRFYRQQTGQSPSEARQLTHRLEEIYR